jgi:hypothetical protein
MEMESQELLLLSFHRQGHGKESFLEKRLDKFKVAYTKMQRFGENYLEYVDPYGLRLEIV